MYPTTAPTNGTNYEDLFNAPLEQFGIYIDGQLGQPIGTFNQTHTSFNQTNPSNSTPEINPEENPEENEEVITLE